MPDPAPTDRQPSSIERPALAWRPVSVIAAAFTVLLLVAARGYDYHRDELYFRMLGFHPSWGYVDQPPFTPLLTRVCIEVFGDSVWAIRVPSAFLIAAVAVVGAAIAREFGGAAVAQSLAALGPAGVLPLTAGHVASTATPDLLVWLGVVFFVVRALLHGRRNAWLAAGAVAGLGLYNKHLVILLLLSLGIGLLLVGPRRVLLSRELWLGVLLALLIGLPNVLYQVLNDFPQARMAEAIAQNKGADSRVQLIPFQLLLTGFALLPVWIAGIVTLLRDPRLRPVRALAVAYPVLLIVILATGGQPYYSAGLVLALVAVGAGPAQRWLAGRPGRQWTLGVGVAVSVLMAVVFALPVLPADRLGPIAEASTVVADQIGWPEYVAQISAVYAALPPADQQRAVIVTGNYGEAGALDRYGEGLPPVYSGHNELYRFGPPPDDRTLVLLVSQAPRSRVDATFGGCEFRGRLDNDAGVENEELDAGLYVCRTLPAPWRQLWPGLRHFD